MKLSLLVLCRRPDHFSDPTNPNSLPVDANINVTWFFKDSGDWTAFDSSHTITHIGAISCWQNSKAEVSFVDEYGIEKRLGTQQSEVIANINDAPTGATSDRHAVLGSELTDLAAVADEDGLTPMEISWQRTSDGVWTDVHSTNPAAYALSGSDLGQQLRIKAQYVDGWGTEETLYSLATDKVYGFSGNRVIFPEYDDPENYCILLEDDLLHANSFQIDFDFTFDSTLVDQTVLINCRLQV